MREVTARMSSEEFWTILEEGEDYYEEGDFESALDRFDRAVAMSPHSADAHNSRGNALLMLGRHEEALASFEKSLELEPGFVKAALNRAELLVDHLGRIEEGRKVCDYLLKRPLELIDAADAYFVKSKAALTLGDLRAALAMADKAIGLASDRPEFIALRGGIHFEQGDYRKALAELDKALRLAPDDPDAHYRRGLALEKLDRAGDADAAFQRAAQIDAEHYPPPMTMSPEEFERLAEAALDSLDAPVREFLANVPVLIEDFPSRRIVAEDNVSPQILGLFIGSPYEEKTSISQATVPDQIMLFRKNLEKVATTREELSEEIRKTVLHEVGHYLGFHEHELAELGYE
jgi:predicted Zn-dependent protease with MMP-like domain/predicted negative regulator of RcsB-dependent stress response